MKTLNLILILISFNLVAQSQIVKDSCKIKTSFFEFGVYPELCLPIGSYRQIGSIGPSLSAEIRYVTKKNIGFSFKNGYIVGGNISESQSNAIKRKYLAPFSDSLSYNSNFTPPDNMYLSFSISYSHLINENWLFYLNGGISIMELDNLVYGDPTHLMDLSYTKTDSTNTSYWVTYHYSKIPFIAYNASFSLSYTVYKAIGFLITCSYLGGENEKEISIEKFTPKEPDFIVSKYMEKQKFSIFSIGFGIRMKVKCN